MKLISIKKIIENYYYRKERIIKTTAMPISQESADEIRELTFEQESYRMCLQSSFGEEKEEWRKEWVNCRKRYDDLHRLLIQTYGVTCTEYLDLKNPLPISVNTNSNQIIFPLEEREYLDENR